MPTTEDPPHAQTRLAAIAGASWLPVSRPISTWGGPRPRRGFPESESAAQPGARQVHVDAEPAASGQSRIGYGQADRLSARGYVTKLSACS
mgnify:CR=1 FL=1